MMLRYKCNPLDYEKKLLDKRLDEFCLSYKKRELFDSLTVIVVEKLDKSENAITNKNVLIDIKDVTSKGMLQIKFIQWIALTKPNELNEYIQHIRKANEISKENDLMTKANKKDKSVGAAINDVINTYEKHKKEHYVY